MDSELKKLFAHSSPGEEHYLVVSGIGSRLRTRYNPPLEFDTKENAGYEISLLRLESYFSFPNITTSQNSLRVSVDSGKNWLLVQIPIGCYDIESINTVLQRQLKEKTGEKEEAHVIVEANVNTLKCVLDIRDDATIVDFNIDNSLRLVLGFDAKQYSGAKRYQSESIVNILSVNTILVHTDIIGSSRINGVAAPVIYNFFPNVSPGEKIVSQPRHLIYMPLTMSIIPSMTCWLTDQKLREIDLRGEELTLTFHVRKRR